ncbi:unnamed protein product [Peronospora belbahrii]|uniref:Uncharacterized protein n=1 Tax=Peronospora belbahrii TaxID=622444 RepID=A0AAU9KGD8_9STRA|nr:unnamed protein product [Peronospora belbahrii]
MPSNVNWLVVARFFADALEHGGEAQLRRYKGQLKASSWDTPMERFDHDFGFARASLHLRLAHLAELLTPTRGRAPKTLLPERPVLRMTTDSHTTEHLRTVHLMRPVASTDSTCHKPERQQWQCVSVVEPPTYPPTTNGKIAGRARSSGSRPVETHLMTRKEPLEVTVEEDCEEHLFGGATARTDNGAASVEIQANFQAEEGSSITAIRRINGADFMLEISLVGRFALE